MMLRTLTAISVLALSATAAAQDMSAPANFGSITLETGFTPDPYEVSVTAGGSTAVTQPGCTGYISEAPDFELTYTAGTTFPLNIYVLSEGDTTLLVNLPDGTWVCADDSQGLNPALNFGTPQSGVYDIWVGSYDDEAMPAAKLRISELAPVWE